MKNNAASVSSIGHLPEFFLYTKLGQNETKSLKKAGTNKQERIVLADIFELKSFQTDKLQNLRLNFHFINYSFCKENGFSNEKTSTLIAMLDSILERML